MKKTKSFPVMEVELVQQIPIVNGEVRGNLDTKHSLSVFGSVTEPEEHLRGSLGGTMAKYGRTETNLREIVRAVADSNVADLRAYFYKLAKRIRTYPATYLVVDAVLAYVGDDTSDALLFEDHAFNVLEYDNNFHLLLEVLFRKPEWSGDVDVRDMLTQLLRSTVPPSFVAHTARYGETYRERVLKARQLIGDSK